MAAQSFAMGDAFGTSFQYGKRKISAMDNKEFNALTAEKLHKQIQADVRQMIPHMNESFKRMEKFQSEVVNSILRSIVETAKGIISEGQDIHKELSGDFREFFGQDREFKGFFPDEISTSASIWDVQGGSRTGPLNYAEAQKAWAEYIKNRPKKPPPPPRKTMSTAERNRLKQQQRGKAVVRSYQKTNLKATQRGVTTTQSTKRKAQQLVTDTKNNYDFQNKSYIYISGQYKQGNFDGGSKSAFYQEVLKSLRLTLDRKKKWQNAITNLRNFR